MGHASNVWTSATHPCPPHFAPREPNVYDRRIWWLRTPTIPHIQLPMAARIYAPAVHASSISGAVRALKYCQFDDPDGGHQRFLADEFDDAPTG
jgi:hypothetical protein